jgi:hypothetical protein
MAVCNVCDEPIPEPDATAGLQNALEHLRLFHPDLYGDGPERWPDGDVVLHQEDVSVEDFE